MNSVISKVGLLIALACGGIFAVGAFGAEDGDVLTATIPGGQQLILPYFDHMEADVHSEDARLLTVRVRTKPGYEPMSLTMTFLKNPNGRAPSRQQNADMVTRMAAPYISSSVEGQVSLWQIDTSLGPAMFTSLTDKRAASGSLPPGDFPSITVGQVITDDTAVAITLLTNGEETESFSHALGVIGALVILQDEAPAANLPPAPAGYQWEACPEIKGALLRPDGWHFRKHIDGDRRAYFVSKEDLDVVDEFTTGLTMVAMKGYAKEKGIIASEFAQNFVLNATKSSHVRKAPWTHRMGPFVSHGVIVTTPDIEKGDFVSHHLVIANDETGTVYIVVFESPVKDWAVMKELSEPMLQKLYIDSDI